MSLLLGTPISSITVYTAGGEITARASDVNVIIPVTEELYSAEFIVDWDYAEDLESGGKTIEIGNTVDVYLGRAIDSLTRVFSGRVWDLEKEIIGHTPRWYKFEAKGWGDYLQTNWVGYSRTHDTVDSVIQWIIQPLVDGGTLTIGSIVPTSSSVIFEHLDEELTMWDALNEICENENWDFYVDHDKNFYAHPRGSVETSETFSNMITSVLWRSAGRDIINAQRVVGQMTRQIGSDAAYTEDNTGWTTDGSTIIAVRNTIGLEFIEVPDTTTGAGTFALRTSKIDASGGMYVRKTFGSALDLFMHGELHFSIQYSFFGPTESRHSILGALQFGVRFETDSSNYFEYLIEVTGAKGQKIWSLYPSYRYGWHALSIPFNMRADADPPTIVGNPRWGSIESVKITIVSPTPMAGVYSEGVVMIDNMYFDSGFYYSFKQHSASIAEFGERRGQFKYIPELTSNADCESLADAIVTNYKYPIESFKSIKLNDIPSTVISPGQQATITVSEITNVSQIRSIEYTLRELDLDVNLELSPLHIPTIDSLIAKLSKDLDLLQQTRLPENVIPSAVLGIARGPLGLKDVDISHNPDNLILNPQFEIDSDSDNIPDKWYASDVTKSYKSDDEYFNGQFSGYIPDGETLQSELFPVDNKGGYYYEMWGRGTHDGSQSTFSVFVDYYGTYPTLSSEGTSTIASSISPQLWTRYYKIDNATDVPANARWGRARIETHSGTVAYVDDFDFKKLVGVDAGRQNYVRPLQYDTSLTIPTLMYAETWDVNSMNIKYVVTRVQVELKSEEFGQEAICNIIIKWNDVAKDTFAWSSGVDDWYRYNYEGSIDGGNFGETLSVEYWLQAEPGFAAYMRNMELWVNTYSIKQRLLDPFDPSKRLGE